MFVLPDLPYAQDALEPVMSAATLAVHWGKHHRKYVETTNRMVEKLGWRTGSLEEVVARARASGDQGLFNNAAQAWNHGFFWACMSPEPDSPSGELGASIQRDFGGLEQLRATFIKEGVGHFASGWVWLAARDGKLEVLSTHDADDTLTRPGVKPLLVCDLWEHAYYLDHKNDREGFLGVWFDRLANWGFATRQLEAAQAWTYPAPVAEPA